MALKAFRYGRLLEEFEVGATYAHPWDVTVDAGSVALFQASFLDAIPTYASARFAAELGFRDRPIHPLLLLNFGLSFSVHDVSEQAIAHLAYIDVRFPEACFAGDTVTASSKVIAAKPTSSADRGVVHVRTLLENQRGDVVCAFERKALVRAGKPGGPSTPAAAHAIRAERAHPSAAQRDDVVAWEPRLPRELRKAIRVPTRGAGFAGFAEDFGVGDVFVHEVGRTIGESEHMQLTYLCRNSHPLHFDEVYCKGGASFAGTRVVYGGLVLGWVASIASRDTCGNVLWDLGLDNGAHPNGVVAGDTLYAASKVISAEPHDAVSAKVTFRLVGVKNAHPSSLLEDGADLFTPELSKKDGKTKEKVVEIDRTVLMRRRPA